MDDEDYGVTEMDDAEDEAYDDQVDDMLDALMAESDDFSERARGRRGRGRRKQRGVRTATGRSAYRAPTEHGYVTQKQFKEAMGRVGEENRRNAEGIKTVNTRLGKLDTRVDDVVSVATGQSKKISSFDTRMKLDAAFDFANSLAFDPAGGVLNLDLSQVLRGAVKNGVLGDGKGALSNPWLVGGIAVLLRNPGIIGGILGRP